jgi:hypothetical protein
MCHPDEAINKVDCKKVIHGNHGLVSTEHTKPYNDKLDYLTRVERKERHDWEDFCGTRCPVWCAKPS